MEWLRSTTPCFPSRGGKKNNLAWPLAGAHRVRLPPRVKRAERATYTQRREAPLARGARLCGAELQCVLFATA